VYLLTKISNESMQRMAKAAAADFYDGADTSRRFIGPVYYHPQAR